MNTDNIIMWDGGRLNKDFLNKCQREGTSIIIMFNATRTEAQAQDFSRVSTMFQSLTDIGQPVRQSLLFTFDGWDDDPRGLHEIPDVTRFIRRVTEICLHIWYFLVAGHNSHFFASLVSHISMRNPKFGQIEFSPNHLPFENRLFQFDIPAAEQRLADMPGGGHGLWHAYRGRRRRTGRDAQMAGGIQSLIRRRLGNNRSRRSTLIRCSALANQ